MKRFLLLILLSFISLNFAVDDCNFCCEKKSCDNDCIDNCPIDSCTPVVSSLHFRSQGANTARELVGWQWDINLPFLCEPWGAAYLAFEYTRSLKLRGVTQSLFGGNRLFFAGSLVPDRLNDELVADNFGLSRTFRGTLKICPRIENFIVDFGAFIGLDCWSQGFYFRLHAPFVHSVWDLGLKTDCCDFVCTTTNAQFESFDPCYISSNGQNTVPQNVTGNPAPRIEVPSVDPAQSLEEALSGGFTGGDIKAGWCAGRFDFNKRARTAFADLDLIFGYNIFNNDCFHFGIFGLAVVPTGGKAKSNFIFNPVIGNGGHLELGGGISTHFAYCNSPMSRVGIFIEGNVTHMLRTRQCRLFDFTCNGAFSRYLMLKEFVRSGNDYVYSGRLVSATCFNNRPVKVGIDLKYDASIKFSWYHCGFGIDLGYNIYGHSEEKICLIKEPCCCDVPNVKYGIKGTEPVCCFSYPIVNTTIETPPFTTIPTIYPADTILSSFADGVSRVAPVGCPTLDPNRPLGAVARPNNNTQPTVTAFSTVQIPNGQIPLGACSICLSAGSAQITQPTEVSSLTPTNGFFIANATPPSFVDVCNLDIESARAPKVMTHKGFVHINYTCVDNCFNPSLGIGAEVEFNGLSNRCDIYTLNQWGIWIKGNISF